MKSKLENLFAWKHQLFRILYPNILVQIVTTVLSPWRLLYHVLFVQKWCFVVMIAGNYFLATSLSRWPLRLLVSRVRSLLNIHVISSYCRLLPCNAREKISLIGCAGHSECIGQNMRENFSRMMPIGSIHTIAFIQWAVFLTNKSHM